MNPTPPNHSPRPLSVDYEAPRNPLDDTLWRDAFICLTCGVLLFVPIIPAIFAFVFGLDVLSRRHSAAQAAVVWIGLGLAMIGLVGPVLLLLA